MYLQWIKRQAGVDIAAIPYKGAAQGNPAVFSGEAHLTTMGFGVAGPHLKAGKIKPIVTIGDRRSIFMPELPNLAEEGGDPGLRNYFGAFTAARVPRPIVDQLNREFAKAVRTPKLQALYRASTLEFIENSAAEFAEFVRRDRENAGKLLRSIGVRPSAAPS
jgi:tripartite-type tricarboxylate transporter receptor subunit TctC